MFSRFSIVPLQAPFSLMRLLISLAMRLPTLQLATDVDFRQECGEDF